MIDEVILCVKNNPSVYMGTLKREIYTTEEFLNSIVVKVVTEKDSLGINHPDDLQRVRTLVKHQGLSFNIP